MIIKAGIEYLEVIVKLAALMWKEHEISDLKDEISDIITNDKGQFFLKYVNDIPVGFAQCQLRYDYVEGTKSSPVGYLEGIFIKEEYRRRGYAKELLSQCEKWVKSKGCKEFASDCEINNSGSLRFHIALSFKEVNRIICFKKEI